MSFLTNFAGNYQLNGRYLYRERLLRMHRRCFHVDASEMAAEEAVLDSNAVKVSVDLSHLGEYDGSMLGFVLNQPARILPAMEKGALDALQSVLYERKRADATQDDDPMDEDQENNPSQPNQNGEGQSNAQTVDESVIEEFLTGLSIQILLKGNLKPTNLRSIKSEHMNKLLKCPGIVISTSPVKSRAVQLAVRCSDCNTERTVFATDGPFGSVILPARCAGENCPTNPFSVVPDKSRFVDQQTLKLQEAPERIPTGEMPRSVLLAVERSLVDTAPPGTRVSVLCIPTMFGGGFKGADAKTVYLRVVGMSRENDAHGDAVTFTPAEEEAFRALARRSDVYEIIQRSIAPSIYGNYTIDIKKALACQLFSGSQKFLDDGVRLRGDINVLLLGDPSMAKSQFLKFVSKVAPIGIYTSGKGSSAAGLTASVVKNARGEFYLEGGAMVLADGGIVCIDEFDKMRPADRVAIHEAMEQQTISVAKAGITTVLNSRSSVLAAANPVFGRYDDLKSASDNIDLMTTILSRFDLIFLVRDIREEERDRMICQHVMGVHINSSSASGRGGRHDDSMFFMASGNEPAESGQDESGSSPEAIVHNVMQVARTGEGELDVPAMKKYVQYCKSKCSPRLSEEAGEVLSSSYVRIRDDVRKQAIQASGISGGEDSQAAIPITVRQLEALVRLSESLAKMRLDDDVQPADVSEALRLFKVSTMSANAADQQRADATFASVAAPNRAEMERTENFLRGRLVVGNMVNKQRLIEEAAGQGFNAILVVRALAVMTNRGDLMERNQGRLLKRVK